MRLIYISTAAVLFLAVALGQSSHSRSTGSTIYFLKGETSGRWCAYADESRFKSQIQSLRSMNVGAADYADNHIATIHLTQEDQTGDWAVNDEYILDGAGRLRTLKRTINIIPDNLSEEQVFLIQDGKVIKRSSIYRDLRTKAPTKNSADWFKPPSVVSRIEMFPFYNLIVKRRETVLAKGELCTAEIPPNQPR